MALNFFISHHTKTCKDLIEILATMLEKNKNVCWYAERDIKINQNYTSEIPNAIKNCDVFLLILNKQVRLRTLLALIISDLLTQKSL